VLNIPGAYVFEVPSGISEIDDTFPLACDCLIVDFFVDFCTFD